MEGGVSGRVDVKHADVRGMFRNTRPSGASMYGIGATGALPSAAVASYRSETAVGFDAASAAPRVRSVAEQVFAADGRLGAGMNMFPYPPLPANSDIEQPYDNGRNGNGAFERRAPPLSTILDAETYRKVHSRGATDGSDPDYYHYEQVDYATEPRDIFIPRETDAQLSIKARAAIISRRVEERKRAQRGNKRRSYDDRRDAPAEGDDGSSGLHRKLADRKSVV